MAFYAKDHLKVTRFCELDCNGIEQISVKVQLKKSSYIICCVYRSPSEKVEFWSSLECSWDNLPSSRCIVVGDFNADALDPSNAALKHLVNLSSSHDLSNHIIKPTRITASRKSCLDLLFSTPDLVPVSTCVIEAHCSDHCLVLGEFGLRVPSAPARVFYSRDWHKFDLQSFLRHPLGF